MPTTILLLMILVSGPSAPQEALCQEPTRTDEITTSPREKSVFIPQFGVWVSIPEPNNARHTDDNRPITSETVNTNEESVVDAILEIRQRLGGGISSHLGELVPHSDTDRMFREVVEQIEINRPTPLGNDEDSETRVTSGVNIEAFRQVAKQLDGLACQLEELGCYQSADVLRSEAQKIRKSVR